MLRQGHDILRYRACAGQPIFGRCEKSVSRPVRFTMPMNLARAKKTPPGRNCISRRGHEMSSFCRLCWLTFWFLMVVSGHLLQPRFGSVWYCHNTQNHMLLKQRCVMRKRRKIEVKIAGVYNGFASVAQLVEQLTLNLEKEISASLSSSLNVAITGDSRLAPSLVVSARLSKHPPENRKRCNSRCNGFL